jgi:protein-S-isoprenylcysteine O-methyltransferase Ste14
MVRGMIALTLDSAKRIAIVAIIAFVVFSVLSAWLIKNVVTKLIVVVLCAGLVFAVWTQRTSLQECADKAQTVAEALDTAAPLNCTFFGKDVEVIG